MSYQTRFQTIELRQGSHSLNYPRLNRIKVMPDPVAVSTGARFDGGRLLSEGITYEAPDENGIIDQSFQLDIPPGAGFVVIQLRFCEALSRSNTLSTR